MAKWITREDLLLHVYLKGTSTFVVGSGLHRIDWQTGKFEIGYWVRTKYMGQGFVTEAVNGITAFAFKHLHANRVEIRCDATNIRSAAVAKRCGFLLEGILRHDSAGRRRRTAQHDDLLQDSARTNSTITTNDEACLSQRGTSI